MHHPGGRPPGRIRELIVHLGHALGVGLNVAQVAGVAIPTDVVQINKRTVHPGMEVMGLRAAIRAGTEMAALATHSKTLCAFTNDIVEHGVTGSLTKRDSPFGDYRTSE